MMKVIITRNTVAGKKPVFVGETHDLTDEDAQILIQMGKAKPYRKAPAKKKPAGLATKSASALVKKAKKK